MRLLEAIKAYIAALDKPAHDMNGAGEIPGVLPPPMIRYRPPFAHAAHHDARGDARQIVYESLINKSFEPADAHAIAAHFVDYYAEILHTERVPYQDGVYRELENTTVWCKRISDLINIFMRKISAGEIKPPSTPEGWSRMDSCCHADRNARKTMEDRHIAIHDLSAWSIEGEDDSTREAVKKTSLFAVFDGHGGHEVAAYAAAHFPTAFVEAGAVADEETMKNAFNLFDKRVSVRCETEPWRCGSTAVVAAVNDKQVALGWCGDSSILMLRPMEVERLTTNHTPHNEDEARRVEAAGGSLIWLQGELRVNGVLNVTRSLGDVQGRPMIISDPDTKVIERGIADYALILACDGVAEELKDSEIFDSVKKFCTTHPAEDWHKLAAHVCDVASDVSNDNLSCLFVFLRPPSDLWAAFNPIDDDE